MQCLYLRKLSLVLLSTLTILRTQAQVSSEGRAIVIKHVNIIPMTAHNEIIPNAQLLIKDHRIVSINGPIPDSAYIIEAKGKWLMPGLIDMHIHAFASINFRGEKYPTEASGFLIKDQDFMTLFIANGVTTFLDLNSRVEHLAQRNAIAKGQIIGPRMALAALINGGEGEGKIANTPAEGRQSVRIAKADGYDFIKVYSQLNIETFKAIVDEAEKQGMKVVGHIPNAFKGRLEEAFLPNFSMVAHAEEFAKQSEHYSDQDARYFAQLAKQNDSWLTPTLIVIERNAEQARSLDNIPQLAGFEYLHPLMQNKWLKANKAHQGTSPERIARLEKMIAFNKKLVKAFKEAKVPMVAGTDAGCSGVVYGFSLHDEISLLADAGLSAEEALASATRLPATWMGIDSIIGTVEVGKYADLILLDKNPLENIHNTRSLSGVFLNGLWVDKKTIDTMLKKIAQGNMADKDKYEWRKRKEY